MMALYIQGSMSRAMRCAYTLVLGVFTYSLTCSPSVSPQDVQWICGSVPQHLLSSGCIYNLKQLSGEHVEELVPDSNPWPRAPDPHPHIKTHAMDAGVSKGPPGFHQPCQHYRRLTTVCRVGLLV